MRFPLLKDQLLHQLEHFSPVALSFVSDHHPSEFHALMRTFSSGKQQKPDQSGLLVRFNDAMGEVGIGTGRSMLLVGPRDDVGTILLVLLQSKDSVKIALGGPTQTNPVSLNR